MQPCIRMIIPIWGQSYIERWLNFSLGTLKSEGNFPYLIKHSKFELVILTMSKDIVFMQKDERFRFHTNGIKIKFIAIDELFPIDLKTSYGVPLTLAYAKGILDLGESGIGTYVILWNADVLVSTNSFKNILLKIQSGYNAIGVPALGVNDGHARLMLESLVDKENGVLSISSREMVKLALQNLHGRVTSRIINLNGIIDTNYFHQIFWSISEDCIATRGFLVHPACFQIQRLFEKVNCPVDYGFITELCPNAKFCVMTDSDEFMAMELQAPNSEGHLLRLSKLTSLSETKRLSRLSAEIILQVQKWTTSEHRRNALYTCYFHSYNLPLNIEEKITPFNAFVDEILNKLPPAVSHTKHYQWIPAVDIYRKEMLLANPQANLYLLNDPLNNSHFLNLHLTIFNTNIFILILTSLKTFFIRLKRFVNLQLFKDINKIYLNQLIKSYISNKKDKIDILYIQYIKDHTLPLGLGYTEIEFDLPPPSESDNIFTLFYDPEKTQFATQSKTIIIYLRLGYLSKWSNLKDDIYKLSNNYEKIISVLIEYNFQSISLKTHEYILAMLLNGFPITDYECSLANFLAPTDSNKTFTSFFKFILSFLAYKVGLTLDMIKINRFLNFDLTSAIILTATRKKNYDLG